MIKWSGNVGRTSKRVFGFIAFVVLLLFLLSLILQVSQRCLNVSFC